MKPETSRQTAELEKLVPALSLADLLSRRTWAFEDDNFLPSVDHESRQDEIFSTPPTVAIPQPAPQSTQATNSQPDPPPPTTPSKLLQLPDELLSQILTLALTSPTPIRATPTFDFLPRGHALPCYPRVLRACRRTYIIGQALFYRANTFAIELAQFERCPAEMSTWPASVCGKGVCGATRMDVATRNVTRIVVTCRECNGFRGAARLLCAFGALEYVAFDVRAAPGAMAWFEVEASVGVVEALGIAGIVVRGAVVLGGVSVEDALFGMKWVEDDLRAGLAMMKE